ncbi:hypothetical protein BDP27DRAFT_1212394 [Rhodocollybia butyracea]|uniref:rRNA-processing protein EFG1 n=1 Tax=Rhodocollybia butyracea TaxID=206335 RepID=A0A9P5Q6F6_9AGAR|nr:hypothetical protein BDP27DRAFT_1212394 [Rhodocollybia butyracea]
MGPVRTEKSSSRPVPGPSKRKARVANVDDASSALPGVQKIKSAIRQTKRLLAKEKLAADARVTAERKLKSLEADLAKAEISRKERTMSTRYHKVKFFERQKVVRKINQTKKKLSEADASSGRESFKTLLYEHRVELNYINHYPKTKKYISLFPPEVRDKSSEITPASSAESGVEREEIKTWIRKQMEAGVLPSEPESAQRSEHKSRMQWDEKANKKAVKDDDDVVEEKDDFFDDN